MENFKAEYNYADVMNWLNNKGTELYGSNFKLLEEDNYVIYKLMAYFLKDITTCRQYGLDLSKGILLSGPVGCGKTALMTIMKYLASAEIKYSLKAC
ncbi:MAG TPA: ATPase, partial [Flavobacterium sp.]